MSNLTSVEAFKAGVADAVKQAHAAVGEVETAVTKLIERLELDLGTNPVVAPLVETEAAVAPEPTPEPVAEPDTSVNVPITKS